jgi:hypothetical protein
LFLQLTSPRKRKIRATTRYSAWEHVGYRNVKNDYQKSSLLLTSPRKRKIKATTRLTRHVSMLRVRKRAEMRIPQPQIMGSARGYFTYTKQRNVIE